jgi:hypothetical protein
VGHRKLSRIPHLTPPSPPRGRRGQIKKQIEENLSATRANAIPRQSSRERLIAREYRDYDSSKAEIRRPRHQGQQ